MIRKSTIQLLRFHFSFFLLPVFLFAVSQASDINYLHLLLAFLVLHLLVYPSSNGYNSYMDRDQSPIGGVKNPLQPTRQLFYVSVAMDVVALGISLLISPLFALGILLYILASRAYSYRKIRLKKYPILGFLVVFVFQGGLIFFITYTAINNSNKGIPVMAVVISSMLIGALYPLTQVYQHEEDKKDGVISISYLVGKKGTFIFSMFWFLSATALMYWFFNGSGEINFFYLFLAIMLPVVLFFLYWMARVWADSDAANFENSLKMNIVATLCTTTYFLLLIILKQ